MAMDRVEVITSVERRRRWSAADKVRLVAAIDEAGAVVTEIARAAGVEASLLYRWRRQFAAKRQPPAFVPLRVTKEREAALTVPASTPTPSGSIAICFGAQVHLTVEVSFSPTCDPEIGASKRPSCRSTVSRKFCNLAARRLKTDGCVPYNSTSRRTFEM